MVELACARAGLDIERESDRLRDEDRGRIAATLPTSLQADDLRSALAASVEAFLFEARTLDQRCGLALAKRLEGALRLALT